VTHYFGKRVQITKEIVVLPYLIKLFVLCAFDALNLALFLLLTVAQP